MPDRGLIEPACAFHHWDAMAPAALAAIQRRGPFQYTAETGCGGSTIMLSHASRRHLSFAIEGENRTITSLRTHGDLQAGRVGFVEGETRDTLPGYRFQGEWDLALLDGPHAYPLPQIEFAYLSGRIRLGGWLAIDDLQIPSVHELFRFLRRESGWTLEEVALRTAFFRRVEVTDRGPDGWTPQGINRRPVWRYSWRDRLRRLAGKFRPGV